MKGRHGKDMDKEEKHKEEGVARRRWDKTDCRKIALELESTLTPLMSSIQVSIISAKAKWHLTVNVQDALAIRCGQSKQFSDSLSNDFHTIIKKKVRQWWHSKNQIMVALKKNQTTVAQKIIHCQGEGHLWQGNAVQPFCSCETVAQWGDSWYFPTELSPVPPALIDEYNCLRKGNKAADKGLTSSSPYWWVQLLEEG